SAEKYERADLGDAPDLDHRFGVDSKLPVPSQTYDLVLSTQVLEHVQDPSAYLNEALRVLQPGGRLVLTTHGVFPDHACPHDYQRWTADGLRLLVERSGFT